MQKSKIADSVSLLTGCPAISDFYTAKAVHEQEAKRIRAAFLYGESRSGRRSEADSSCMAKKQFEAYSVSGIMIFGSQVVMVLNIFRKTNLKKYMELTSMLPICRRSFKGIRNWTVFWNVCVSV